MTSKFNQPFLVAAFVAAMSFSFLSGVQAQEAAKPVAVQSAVILSPANSYISFVGIHVGDDPKPRLGGFEDFFGYVTVDANSKSVTGMYLEINVDSVWTEYAKLTGHLKNEDFFETDKFPRAKFVSTSVKNNEAGECQVTGNLMLHGQTKEITFPASYSLDGGLVLSSEFKLDRSMFGMDKMLSGVAALVSMKFEIGKKTSPKAQQGGHGGKKKKQSKTETKTKTQQVSLKLPNMS